VPATGNNLTHKDEEQKAIGIVGYTFTREEIIASVWECSIKMDSKILKEDVV
jgi:hypothetical protein